jgi:transcriptional regulator with GAF, ATPase, and Fis domain
MAQIASVETLDRDGATPSSDSLFDKAFMSSGLSINALERQLYQEAIARADGNLSAAARSLGLTRAQLAYRIAKEGD